MNQKAEFGQKSRQRLLQRKSNTYNLERGTALMEPILKSITIPGNRLAPIVTGAHHQSTLIFPCRRAFITKFNYQELTRFSSALPAQDLVRWRKSEVRDNFGKNGEWWIQGRRCVSSTRDCCRSDRWRFYWISLGHDSYAMRTWTITSIRKKYARRFFTREDGWNVHWMRELMFFFSFFLFSSFSQATQRVFHNNELLQYTWNTSSSDLKLLAAWL